MIPVGKDGGSALEFVILVFFLDGFGMSVFQIVVIVIVISSAECRGQVDRRIEYVCYFESGRGWLGGFFVGLVGVDREVVIASGTLSLEKDQ